MGRKLESTNTYKRITQGTEGSLCRLLTLFSLLANWWYSTQIGIRLNTYVFDSCAITKIGNRQIKSSVLANDYFRFLFRYLRGQAYKQGLTGMELTRRGRERGHPIDQRIGHKSSYQSKTSFGGYLAGLIFPLLLSPFLVCYIMTRVTCRL